MTAAARPTQEQLAEQINRCIDAGEIVQGLAICQRLNHGFPAYSYGWYLASFLMKRAGNFPDALRAIDRALQLSYSDRYQLHKAKCLFEGNDIAAASAAVGMLRNKLFAEAQLHNDLASLLHMLGDHQNALQHYSRAVELDGSNAEFHFNRGAVQRYLGDAAGAEQSFDAAIACNPLEFEAYNARAQLRTQTTERNHVAQIRQQLARTTGPVGLTQLCYALAKELEDVGDVTGAFDALQRGAGVKRQHMQYNLDTDLQIIGRIRAVYGPELFDGPVAGCECADPIFILGMPRTGTTLVERILSSHSQVHSAGELNNFSLELLRLVRQTIRPPPVSRLDFVTATARLDFRALGNAYLQSTRPLRDASPFFIDKLPFNYLYAGLIHLALPHAKIINLQRHPMDTCYAVYKQLFRDAYPFSYDLDELGQYFIAYHGLMQHWNAVMPGVIYTLRYEAVVADVAGEARRLLAYCGLPWEEQCLRFYQNSQASTTASAMQVRQPIYDSSVGKWRRYATQLEPLRLRLENAGIATGS
ncbi:MAG: sulfotransferase [Steroidobacteraceae bacterium]